MTIFKKTTIHNSFIENLPADPKEGSERRQVFEACYSFVNTFKPENPSLIHISQEMLAELGIPENETKSNEFLDIFSGRIAVEGCKPFAMCYGGHQFGNWAGQLGDGRAINIAEVVVNDKRWALQLKGSGETPYSRSADGLAVLRSSIREYLCSEAMHHLGVPTTRALSLVLSGNQVMRDMLYDGNPALEKGAIVCRVAPSFVRFGNFEIFASRRDKENLKKLADYTIKYFFPELHSEANDKKTYLAFFEKVVSQTQEMILHWQRVGFVHGVMNTDNMSILGLTIDYGPYGWLDNFDPDWTPNTTDAANRRYRYDHQPSVALWNLTQLANALFPLIEDVEGLRNILSEYKTSFEKNYLNMMRQKVGFLDPKNQDQELIVSLEELLQFSEIDMTLFYRKLSDFEDATSFLPIVFECSYQEEKQFDELKNRWVTWLQDYENRLARENTSLEERKKVMNQTNPKYVLRNYMAQLAIEAVDKGDYALIDELYQMLKKPYDEQTEMEKWFTKRPDWAKEKVGCSMLSCSS
jgi:serine/tyrosine/threonine adenylyltransferase